VSPRLHCPSLHEILPQTSFAAACCVIDTVAVAAKAVAEAGSCSWRHKQQLYWPMMVLLCTAGEAAAHETLARQCIRFIRFRAA